MASVTYVKISDLQKAYKRSSTKLYRTYTKRVSEYSWMDDYPNEDIVPSGRENLVPLDVARGYGAHQADDGGYESRTETPALKEGSFVFNHTNSRFSISLRAQAFDKAARGNFIIRQVKYQSIKCIEAVMRKYAYMYYGLSSGVVALNSGTQGAAQTHTLTLKSGFGLSQISSLSYLANMFTIGEGIALVVAGGNTLRANAIGHVTSVSLTNGQIGVQWDLGSNVTPTDNDQIVFANGVTGTSLSETDWQKWNTGLLDIAVTDSVQNLATSAEATWGPALYDTNGGSFGFVKIKKMRQALENTGDTTLRRIVWSNGVENDVQALERSAVMWTDSGRMNIDANVTAKGVSFDTSRFTPPTFAFGIGADLMGKKVITEKPDEEEMVDFAQLYKAEDRSALKGGVDIISANIVRSRSRLAVYGALTEQ
jgi:hypothetical protein